MLLLIIHEEPDGEKQIKVIQYESASRRSDKAAQVRGSPNLPVWAPNIAISLAHFIF